MAITGVPYIFLLNTKGNQNEPKVMFMALNSLPSGLAVSLKTEDADGMLISVLLKREKGSV